MKKWFKVRKEEPINIENKTKEYIKEEYILEPKQDAIVIDDIEYIWVEGYKGTSADMSCTVAFVDYNHWAIKTKNNKQVYEINEKVEYPDVPVTGSKGFHFCVDLKNVFKYYQYDFKNRYFKVKALVKKEEWEKEEKNNVFASKAIILTEEVFPVFEEIAIWDDDKNEKYIEINHKKLGSMMLVQKDFEEIQRNNIDLEHWQYNKFFHSMQDLGYSELFIKILFDEAKTYQKQLKIVALAKALHKEGVSKEMAIYLLMVKLHRNTWDIPLTV